MTDVNRTSAKAKYPVQAMDEKFKALEIAIIDSERDEKWDDGVGQYSTALQRVNPGTPKFELEQPLPGTRPSVSPY